MNERLFAWRLARPRPERSLAGLVFCFSACSWMSHARRDRQPHRAITPTRQDGPESARRRRRGGDDPERGKRRGTAGARGDRNLERDAAAARDGAKPAIAAGQGHGAADELKGGDSLYPLYGTIAGCGRGPALTLAADEILVTPALAERLGVREGSSLRYGAATFEFRDSSTTSRTGSARGSLWARSRLSRSRECDDQSGSHWQLFVANIVFASQHHVAPGGD